SDPETPRQRYSGVFRPSRHIERPNRGHQRQARTPPWHRPRVPEPDKLHRPIAARSRRIPNPTTPSIMKSPFVPAATMPHWLRGFAEYQPVTPIIETLRGLWMGTDSGHQPVVALLWCG